MSTHEKGDVFEVALRINSTEDGTIEVLKGVLMNIGISPNEIIECEQWPHTFLMVYSKTLAKAKKLQSQLKAFHFKQVRVILKTLKKKDWQTKWKKEFKPFSLTKSFAIIPFRFRGKRQLPGKMPIYLDTDLAFGTGLHATTRFMAGFVEKYKGRYDTFLDLGTGTGILSMIASKCGAKDVMAIDICPDSVKVARQNCSENDCTAIKVEIADAHKSRSKKQYDFVAANIITQDLIKMGSKLVNHVKPGKYLAVSGISLNSYETFRESFAKYPLRCLKIEKGEGWVALLYKKQE